jgi:bacillithiol biosynthesis cysteine-adding enzyme BshC
MMGVMNAKILLEFLPADIAGLSPLARAALGGKLDLPGVRVARCLNEVQRPIDRFEPEVRKTLAEKLEAGLASVSPPVAALESLRALAEPGACAVVTGQQPGLACGPLYSVWKGLQAIALAKKLSKEWGTPVVPMFWNHADDHDIAEVHHTWLLNRNVDLQKAGLAGLSSGRQPFSKILLEEKRHKPAAFAALLRSIYGDYPHVDEAVEAFAPRAGETLARAFTRGMTALLGRQGLVVFEPDWIREDLSSALSRIVSGDAPAALAEGEERLKAAGHAVALPSSEAALVYRIKEDGRHALRPGGEGYQYDGEPGSRTAAELAAEILQEPESFSAGALLRPLAQDIALPVCAYIGGWGELAYHAQLGALREATGVTESSFVPRLSITLSDEEVRSSLQTLGCSVADIIAARGEWSSAPEEGERPSVLDALHELAKTSRDSLLEHRDAISAIDRGLAAGLKRAADNLQATVEKVAHKAERSHANSSGKGRRHERRANHALFPREGTQERSLGPAPFVARYGFGWLGLLLEELDPFALEHIHCALSESAEG